VLEPLTMRPHLGFTMIELMVVLAVMALLATLVAPSFNEQIARRRLEGVATDLSTDLQFARTQAVDDRATVRLITEVGGTQYRLVKDAGAGAVIKTVVFPAGITATDAVTVDYEQLRGTATVTNGPINLTSTRTTATMQADVNMAGRVRLCSPLATLKGYPQC
jgi:type IV fimbrial biogenesis protein FimT